MDEKTTQTQGEEMALPETIFEQAETTPSMLTVKYNGEEKQITLDEAVVLAQKGMNYDHVVAERDSKYKRELDVLERYAAMSGLNRDEYVRRLAEEGADDNDKLLKLQPLYAEYPDLRGKDLPDIVSDRIESGVDPLEAYRAYEISRLTAELEEERQRALARNRAIGSLSADMRETTKDEFLDGFFM